MQFTLRERHPRPISAGPRLVSAAVWLNSDTLRAKNSEVHLIIEWVEQVGGTCADINIAEIVRVKLPFSPLSSPRLSFRTSRFDLETFPRCVTMAWLSFPVVVHRKGSFFALTCLFACLLIANSGNFRGTCWLNISIDSVQSKWGHAVLFGFCLF